MFVSALYTQMCLVNENKTNPWDPEAFYMPEMSADWALYEQMEDSLVP